MSGAGRGRGKARGRYRPDAPVGQSSQGGGGGGWGGGCRGPPPASGGGQPPALQGAWAQRPPSTRPQMGPPAQGAWSSRPPGPSQGAWAARSQAPLQQYEREVRKEYREPPSAVAQSSQAGGGDVRVSRFGSEEAHAGGGGDASGQYTGRGGIRGQRIINDYNVQSKPSTCVTKRGQSGRQVVLCANYFDLESKPDWCIYQYRVDFAPEEELTAIRKTLFRTAVKDCLSGYLFDGTVMYTPNRLPTETMELFVMHTVSSEKTRITIKLVGDVVHGDHHYLQLFNIIVRKCMTHLNLQLVGRNYFDAAAKSALDQMEIWPGYVTSIRQHEKKILMCCEITHKVMQFQTAYDIWCECLKVRNRNPMEEYRKKIIGCVVLTDYNNKTYRISDVDDQQTPSDGFLKKDGTKITYAQYFAEKYRRKVSDMRQPILVHRSKGREIRAGMSELIFLVPELCRMTGLTDRQRQNFTLMRNLATFTRVTPNERIKKTLQFSQRLRSNKNAMEEIKQWDFQLATNIIEFPGRILAPERVVFNDHSYIASSSTKIDWTNDLKTHRMFIDNVLNNWVIIYTKHDETNVRAFVNTLRKVSNDMKWSISNPTFAMLHSDDGASYVQKIKSYVQERPQTQLVLCILANNRADRYSVIKRECILKLQLPSQVVLSKNIAAKQKQGGASIPPGGSLSVISKVAVQMNAKIGGSPWTVMVPLKHLMVIGYDVCHDPNDKSKSIGAIVASMDTHLTRYCSNTTKHTNGQELSSNISINCVTFVQRYKMLHNILPERIIIYRDGVGDGQLHYVHEHEIVQLKADLEKVYEQNGQELKLAFIVVSKRINTRIFLNKNNPDAGTVVDDVITLPQRYDFFLVSQCVHQGTVTPTSYNIIYDNVGLSADKLQILSYKLTHMYYNWSGTVRVPAPCQYAHKLAFLTAQSLREVYTGQKMDNLLYFL